MKSMRAVLSIVGPIESVRRMLALAVALQRKGHAPVVVLSPEYAAIAARVHVPAISLSGLNHAQLSADARQAELPLEALTAAALDISRSLADLCLNADVLIGTSGQPACNLVHQTLSIPYVTVRGPGEWAGHADVNARASLVMDECRRQAGLPLKEGTATTCNSTRLALVAMNRSLLPESKKEPPSAIVGFFHPLHGAAEHVAENHVEVKRFFDAGPPPVVVLLETQEELEAMVPFLHKPILANRYRFVIQHPRPPFSCGFHNETLKGLSGNSSGNDVRGITAGVQHICGTDFVPQSLLHKAALIVHRGGAESSVTAFQAGIPMIVMPRTAEQFAWAELAKSRGVTRHILPYEHVTAERMAAAIQGTLTLPEYAASAAALAAAMEHDDGVAAAVELIEELVSRREHTAASQPLPSRHEEVPALVRCERQPDFPLSFAQQRLWFLDQLAPGNPAYNMPLSLRLRGPLDVEALHRSLTELVKRHESLRTIFVSSTDGPVQKISHVMEVGFQRLDVTSLTNEHREAEALRIACNEAGQPFDLSSGPLFRSKLLKLDAEDHVLLLTAHHIVCDGWSVFILLRDLTEMYEAYVKGTSPRLPDLALQYVDYTVWQRKWLQGPVLEQQLEYWRRQLEGLATLNLPTDHPRTAQIGSRAARVQLHIESAMLLQIKELCRQEKTTLFTALLTAWQVLFAKYSGQPDVAVGTAIANRIRKELERVVGFFVNSLVLRTRLDGDPTLVEALRRAREVALAAYRNQDVPLEKLAQELQPDREAVQTPFFQTMLILENIEDTLFQLHGLQVSAFGPAYDSAAFELTLAFRERQDALSGEILYMPELYDPETIQQMARHWRRVLKEMALRTELKMDELSLLEEAERRQLLVEWNGTASAWPQLCVHELIEKQAALTPGKCALEFEGRTLTYRDLNESANQLGRWLQKSGVRREDKVAILLERRLEILVVILGIWKAGAAYVPLDPGYPAERLVYMLEDSKAGLVISEPQMLERLPHDAAVIDIEKDWGQITKLPRESPAVAVFPMNLAYTIYTSGSTGKPKGVEITHNSVVNFLTAMQINLAPGPQDVYLALTPLSFDIAGLELYLPLCTGGAIKLLSRTDSQDAFRLMQRISEGATLVQATPSTWQMLLDAGWSSTREQKILCGGEALTMELAKRLTRQSGRVWNMYGPTETTIWSLMQSLGPDDTQVLIGRPVANTEVHVLDKNMSLQPVGVAGELYIGGAGLARGYAHRPDLTAERFVPNPFSSSGGDRLYSSGDRVRWRLDGRLEFLGRVDQQVKIRGHRIELGEIESVLDGCPLVRQSVVVCREDHPGGQQLVVYVVAKAGMQASTEELMKFATKRLPPPMVPSVTVWLEQFPLTPSRKVDRKRLPKPQPTEEGPKIPPRNRNEEILCHVWSEVLRRDRIGVTENFFQLGGHSLLAAQVSTRLRSLHQIELPLRVIFDHPTIAGLATWLSEAQNAEEKVPPLMRVSRKIAIKKS
jgi:amino acid adenylation domain-containing protein